MGKALSTEADNLGKRREPTPRIEFSAYNMSTTDAYMFTHTKKRKHISVKKSLSIEKMLLL